MIEQEIISAGGPGYDWNVEKGCLIGIFLSCFCGAVYTTLLGRWVMKQPQGTPAMQKVSNAIREGAKAFVRVQYTAMVLILLDDPRNPAVVADLVGDNVGDCAGRGADLYESMTAENIGAMILGASVAKYCPDINSKTGFILFPLVLHCAGMFSSMIAILTVHLRTKKTSRSVAAPTTVGSEPKVDATAPSSTDFETPVGTPARPEPIGLEDGKQIVVEHKAEQRADEDEGEENGMTALTRGYVICLIIAAVLMVILCRLLLYSDAHPRAWAHFFGAGMIGVLLSWAFVYITDYYTSTEHHPVKKIATAGNQGHGPVVIHGLAVGMESTGAPVVCIGIALLASYWLGATSGLGPWSVTGIYGTACATMGMLITCGYILAMDTFGPISDNAGGVAEMSGSPEHIRRRTDKLDCVGNTTKALTKGYAVGTAGLATFLLFRAFLDEVADYTGDISVKDVNLGIPEVFVSGLLGVMVVIFFASLAMTAVGSAAQVVITEVRRQFQEMPGILQNTEQPDYDACVAIVTTSALKEMILPGVLVVLSPIVLGLIMRGLGEAQGSANLAIPCLAAFLMTVTMGGVNFGLFLNNAGGAWDNAKKLVATNKAFGGKHGEAHRACVTGDTVGDPCKDTAGPSLHVLVKLISTITLVWYPLFVNGK